APQQAAAAVIDVRTPAEYAAGHLQGALSIDWQSDSFAAAAANLDPDGRYLLYCPSGRRAEQAQTSLRDQGFSPVDNLGGLDAAAAATGLPIVT
ncbi:MAG: rhodanese-like domain-containing protein, partial [Propionibacteriaceae bacterium]|nr:rhodanese-like domain-containing protein [Propionibacteriaceae bacterium]